MIDYVHGPYWYGWKDIATPKECGVYFLLQDGFIQYIGRSENMHKRIRTHCYASKIRSGEFTVECYPVPFEDSVRLEREWIALINPPLNQKLVTRECKACSRLRNAKWRESK